MELLGGDEHSDNLLQNQDTFGTPLSPYYIYYIFNKILERILAIPKILNIPIVKRLRSFQVGYNLLFINNNTFCPFEPGPIINDRLNTYSVHHLL